MILSDEKQLYANDGAYAAYKSELQASSNGLNSSIWPVAPVAPILSSRLAICFGCQCYLKLKKYQEHEKKLVKINTFYDVATMWLKDLAQKLCWRKYHDLSSNGCVAKVKGALLSWLQ